MLQGRAAARASAEPALPLEAINTYYFPHAGRARDARLGARERLRGYAEVQLGMATEQALAEAARCFSCGNCIFCDNCLDYCPELAVRRSDGAYAVDGDYCKGCGLCAEECPTGSIAMREELR